MATIKSFEEIEVWKRARVFSQMIFSLSKTEPFTSDKRFSDQINASTGSIMDNIAEGFGRGGNREFITFLAYARGSADESRSQLYRAFDRNYINEETFIRLKEEALEISKMITGFMNHLKGSDLRGSKFMEPLVSYDSLDAEESTTSNSRL